MNESLSKFLTELKSDDTVAFFLSSGTFIGGQFIEYNQNSDYVKISMKSNSTGLQITTVKEMFIDITKIVIWGKS